MTGGQKRKPLLANRMGGLVTREGEQGRARESKRESERESKGEREEE